MKIVLLGPPGCGKSTIFYKICFDAKPNNELTVGCDYAAKNIVFDKRSYQITLWDVAGCEVDSPLMKVYLRDALGVFLVSDLLDYSTVEQLPKYKEKVSLYADEYTGRGVPIIILQNRVDLKQKKVLMPKSSLDLTDLMEYTYNNGFETAFQTSGITGEGLREALDTMIGLIEERDLINQHRRKTRIKLKKTKSQEYNREIERLNKNSCF